MDTPVQKRAIACLDCVVKLGSSNLGSATEDKELRELLRAHLVSEHSDKIQESDKLVVVEGGHGNHLWYINNPEKLAGTDWIIREDS